MKNAAMLLMGLCMLGTMSAGAVGPVRIDGMRVALDLKPFEIVTLRLLSYGRRYVI